MRVHFGVFLGLLLVFAQAEWLIVDDFSDMNLQWSYTGLNGAPLVVNASHYDVLFQACSNCIGGEREFGGHAVIFQNNGYKGKLGITSGQIGCEGFGFVNSSLNSDSYVEFTFLWDGPDAFPLFDNCVSCDSLTDVWGISPGVVRKDYSTPLLNLTKTIGPYGQLAWQVIKPPLESGGHSTLTYTFWTSDAEFSATKFEIDVDSPENSLIFIPLHPDFFNITGSSGPADWSNVRAITWSFLQLSTFDMSFGLVFLANSIDSWMLNGFCTDGDVNGDGQLNPGDTWRYNAWIHVPLNESTFSWPNNQFSVQVDPFETFVLGSATSTVGSLSTESSSGFTWNVGDLAPDDTVQISWCVTINANTPQGHIVCEQGFTYISGNDPAEGYPTDDVDNPGRDNSLGIGSANPTCAPVVVPLIVAGDPHFQGFNGDSFDFMGQPGKIYNLYSDESVQVNGLFSGNNKRTVVGEVAIALDDKWQFHILPGGRGGGMVIVNEEEVLTDQWTSPDGSVTMSTSLGSGERYRGHPVFRDIHITNDHCVITVSEAHKRGDFFNVALTLKETPKHVSGILGASLTTSIDTDNLAASMDARNVNEDDVMNNFHEVSGLWARSDPGSLPSRSVTLDASKAHVFH